MKETTQWHWATRFLTIWLYLLKQEKKKKNIHLSFQALLNKNLIYFHKILSSFQTMDMEWSHLPFFIGRATKKWHLTFNSIYFDITKFKWEHYTWVICHLASRAIIAFHLVGISIIITNLMFVNNLVVFHSFDMVYMILATTTKDMVYMKE